MSYPAIVPKVIDEIRTVLAQVDERQVDDLVEAVIAAEKIFIFAVGRVFLSLKCLGKRLGHLGIDCQIVGAVNEKPISANDLMLIASGSGESKLPVEIARIARSKGATLGLITSAQRSTLSELADIVVRLPTPTKRDEDAGVASIQPMSTLFDQTLHIFGDVLSLMIQERKSLRNEDLWRNHANLE